MDPVQGQSPQRKRNSIISTLRSGLQYELFRDLQDHLFERFARPSLVVIVADDGSLHTCFPAKRLPLPDELYHHLTAATARDKEPIERHKMEKVNYLISLGAAQHQSWGWHVTHPGIVDLYLPIYCPSGTTGSQEPSKRLFGVLVVGRFRDTKSGGVNGIHKWLDELAPLLRMPEKKLSGAIEPAEATDYLAALHILVDAIPPIEDDLRKQIEYESARSIALLERLLSRTTNAELLFGEQGLIAQLGLPEPGPSVTTSEMWVEVAGAFRRIAAALPVSSAAAYAATDRDYTDMELVAQWPTVANLERSLSLASIAEFQWLQDENWVNLPRTGDHFSWLDPKKLSGTEHAILLGRSFVGGWLLVLCFGFDDPSAIGPSQRTALYDAVTSRILPYVEAALSAIELDYLMAETGHLLGRAAAKVDVGSASLLEILPKKVSVKSKDRREYQLAQWAIKDGLTRLKLIRQNFYSFAANRRGLENDDDFLAKRQLQPVDIIAVINDMREFFGRAIEESPLKAIRYEVSGGSLISMGSEDDLRVVLLNLFDNALKFSYVNTHIVLRCAPRGTSAVLEMENLGIGVAHDEQRYVFRELARSRYHDPTRRIEGLGLGLAYCRRVVEDTFRGKIRLASREAQTPKPRRFEGDNWLTTVTLDLPLLEAESVRSEQLK